MKRILFVDHTSSLPRGAEQNLVELLCAFSDAGDWKVACACPEGGRLSEALFRLAVPQCAYDLGPELEEFHVGPRPISIWEGWQQWRAFAEASDRLYDIIRVFQPHAVISCTIKDHLCAARACRPLKAPCIWWVNEIISADFFPWAARAGLRWVARRQVARVVVVSDYARRALVEGGMPENRVRTIHNGLLLDRYLPLEPSGMRELLSLPDFEPVIGLVGRFTPWKGQAFFLQLARAWRDRGWLGQFILIGQTYPEDRAYEKSLIDYVQEHRLEDCVRFAPFQTNIGATLGALDVLVHASTRPEPLGRVILEAMAVGVPVLAARAGGVTEIITDRVDGVLAEPGNLEDYLTKLRAMIDGGSEMAVMRRTAKQTVVRRFTAERMRTDFERLVNEVCAEAEAAQSTSA